MSEKQIVYCEATTSNSQCANKASKTVDGELIDGYSRPVKVKGEHVAHLCGIHFNQMNRRGRIYVYTGERRSGWPNRPVSAFRPIDRSAYEANEWKNRFTNAIDAARQDVISKEHRIDLVAREHESYFVAFVVDGIEIPDTVKEEMRIKILELRDRIEVAQREKQRLEAMTWQEYRAEKEAKGETIV